MLTDENEATNRTKTKIKLMQTSEKWSLTKIPPTVRTGVSTGFQNPLHIIPFNYRVQLATDITVMLAILPVK